MSYCYMTIKGKRVFFDKKDEALVKAKRWSLQKCKNVFYVTCSLSRYKSIPMHRYILNPPDDKHIDHKNHNGLDNRRSNLRICTRQENNRNCRKRKNASSKYKGVSYRTDRAVWTSNICVNGKMIYLGYFEDERKAALRYNKEAKKYLVNLHI